MHCTGYCLVKNDMIHPLITKKVWCESINCDPGVPIEENIIMDDLSRILVYIIIGPKKGQRR